MPLRLEKQGTFTTSFIGSPEYKCGPEATTQFAYQLRIDATNESLSPEGFIIENGRLQAYFDNAYSRPQPVKSCERIAADACKAIGERLIRERISVQAVRCSIAGTGQTMLTATWFRPGIGAFNVGEVS